MNVSLEPGSVVAGRYRLDRLLGRGGMGQVWAVTHEVTLHTAALKLLNGPVQLRPDRRRRFLREARAASSINHPNVVRIHDFFELEDGTPVMLMDLLEGETLGRRLTRERTLSLRETVDVLLPVISAVGTAHALGIVHRDLKPDNVFLLRSGDGRTDVRVLDFGIAKLSAAAEFAMSGHEEATDTGTMLGTPYYMSPEQCFGDKDADHRTDIWALGVMLYESLSGVRPIDGENLGRVLKRLTSEAITPIQALVPDLPAEVITLIGSMLSRDPSARPGDLREVYAALTPHAGVAAQPFDAATKERPPPLDSSPSSGRGLPAPPPPSVRPDADTEVAAPDELRVEAGALPAIDRRGAAVQTPTQHSRGVPVVVAVLAVLLLAGIGVTRHWSAGPEEPALHTEAPSATVPARPATTSPPLEPSPEPRPAGAPSAPSASPVGGPPADVHAAQKANHPARAASNRSVKAEASPAPSAGKEPAVEPALAPSGLVDDPPF